MGAYLDKPITKKISEGGTTEIAWWGACGM